MSIIPFIINIAGLVQERPIIINLVIDKYKQGSRN